jgi:hypothetical protein
VRVAVVVLIASGCGKQLNADYCAAHATDPLCTSHDAGDRRDADRDSVAIDAPMATRLYVGTTAGQLHAVNPATMQAQLVGVIDDPDAPGTPMTIEGLGFAGDGTLVGVTDDDYLLRIDATTANVTSKVSFATGRSYWGMTVAPAGELGTNEVVLVAANDTASLYEVNSDGTLRTIGAFGNGLAVAGDIAWVPGKGLFASVTGSGCSGTCIASVSATTGQATLLAATGPGDMWALAVLAGQLWAVGGNSDAHTVNVTTGVTTQQFDTSISGVSDAAP